MAVRETVTTERSVPGERAEPMHGIHMSVFDPRDRFGPIASFLDTQKGKWADRQDHGRLIQEEMVRHPAVEAPYEVILNFLKSIRGHYSSPNRKVDNRQAEMSEFLNAQVARLGSTGDANDSWTMLVDGLFGLGLRHGFSLGEMDIVTENYRNRPMKQIRRILTLPQSSLDNGIVPRKELGVQYQVDARYHCFDTDDKGRITGVHQYRDTELTIGGQRPDVISWTGERLNNILHFKHKGGDGNPYGQSLFWSAFDPWSKLYLLEEIEQIHLTLNAVPFMTVNRKADRPSPDFNQAIKDSVEERGEFNLVIANNAEFGSWTAANESFTKHIKQNKDELRQYIAQSLLTPAPIYEESTVNEQNFRDMLVVFLKYRLPAIAKEIADFMTWQFGKRLIDANYSNVDITEYPRFEFDTILDSEIKEAIPVIQQALPYMDSERLPEILSFYLPGFRREWVPEKYGDSVEVKRPRRDSNDEYPVTGGDSKTKPPDQTGERGTRQEPEGAP